MPSEYEHYLMTGEFARICGVAKHTLFHYDDIGVLKPEIVDEIGYRYYSIRQLSIFDIIMVLKQVGAPLKEIKGYIENQNTDYFLEILAQKKIRLDEEHKKLRRMQQLLQSAIDTTNYAIHETYAEPRVEKCSEAYLIATNISQEVGNQKRAQRIYDQYRYCTEHDLFMASAIGFIIGRSNFENGQYDVADSFFCITDGRYDNEFLHVKPAGDYAIIDHKGPRETISVSYEKLKAFIGQNHLNTLGDVYEFELVNSLATGNPENFIVEIAIGVK